MSSPGEKPEKSFNSVYDVYFKPQYEPIHFWLH